MARIPSTAKTQLVRDTDTAVPSIRRPETRVYIINLRGTGGAPKNHPKPLISYRFGVFCVRPQKLSRDYSVGVTSGGGAVRDNYPSSVIRAANLFRPSGKRSSSLRRRAGENPPFSRLWRRAEGYARSSFEYRFVRVPDIFLFFYKPQNASKTITAAGWSRSDSTHTIIYIYKIVVQRSDRFSLSVKRYHTNGEEEVTRESNSNSFFGNFLTAFRSLWKKTLNFHMSESEIARLKYVFRPNQIRVN